MSSKIPTKLSSKRNPAVLIQIMSFKLPWFNRELKLLCRKKSRKYKKAKRSGREHHWKEYKELQKHVKKKINGVKVGLH